MDGARMLDRMNTFIPDLRNVEVSAQTTLNTGDEYYSSAVGKIKKFEDNINRDKVYSGEDIYKISHSVVTMLAFACESYLKALYIFENKTPESVADNLWQTFKRSDYEIDSHGYRLYITERGVKTFPRYDANGEPFKDENGKVIYYDLDGNVYNENNRGRALKLDGHYLNRLIYLLPEDLQLSLEMRMTFIPMDKTEKNGTYTILDYLQDKRIITSHKSMEKDEYLGWIEKHKRAFEDSRYPGEKYTEVSVEFMLHLATQLRAISHYYISKTPEQEFTITDDELTKLKDLLQLSPEVNDIIVAHRSLFSENLIKLLINNSEKRNIIINIFSKGNKILKYVNASLLYDLVETMDLDEINYILFTNYYIDNAYAQNSDNNDDIKKLAYMLKFSGIQPSKLIQFCILLKKTYNIKINYDAFKIIFDLLTSYRKTMDKEMLNETYNSKGFVHDIDIYNNYYKF